MFTDVEAGNHVGKVCFGTYASKNRHGFLYWKVKKWRAIWRKTIVP